MNFCLTLAEKDPKRLADLMQQHVQEVPFAEVRLDYLGDSWTEIRPPQGPTQWIATCRPVREGGCFQGPESDRLDRLTWAAEVGFDLIDLEHDVPTPTRLPARLRIVRSRHRFDRFSPELTALLPDVDRPGDISKLAVAVDDTADAVRMLTWMSSHSEPGRVVIGMGAYGQITRYLGEFLGNEWTYVSLPGSATAPGQFDLTLARDIFAHAGSGRSALFGLLGDPVQHSLSPRLHNQLFGNYGIDGVYFPLRVDSVEPFLNFVARSPLLFRGFSVTMPHKLAAARWLDPESQSLKPINTLIHQGDWSGANTDLGGFLEPLEQRIRLNGARVVVLGAGGVARTVLEALLSRNAEPLVVARKTEVRRTLEREYGCSTLDFSELPVSGQVLVNATPIGQTPCSEASPWPGTSLDFEVVYDLIYQPRKTRLLALAEQAGAQVISGREMFVRQAALQFLAWTGIEPNAGMMEEILAYE